MTGDPENTIQDLLNFHRDHIVTIVNGMPPERQREYLASHDSALAALDVLVSERAQLREANDRLRQAIDFAKEDVRESEATIERLDKIQQAAGTFVRAVDLWMKREPGIIRLGGLVAWDELRSVVLQDLTTRAALSDGPGADA